VYERAAPASDDTTRGFPKAGRGGGGGAGGVGGGGGDDVSESRPSSVGDPLKQAGEGLFIAW